ncbi:MAG TPA: hypothetical protein VHR85_10320 [Nocardioides sp.]|nr:hypothetical protein [Nocardioides sp.]
MTRVPRHPWYDVGWPAAAGLATGAGLLAAYVWMGPWPLLLALAVLEITFAPVAWSLLTDLGHGLRRVVLRIAPTSAVAVLTVVGLAEAIGPWTFLVAGLVLLTSPLLRGWTGPGFVPTLAERLSPRVETRHRFDEIVAHGLTTPEDLPPR